MNKKTNTGWANSSFKCCKTFNFLENYQSAIFLTDILQITHNSQIVRLDAAISEKSSVLVRVIFQENHQKKAKKFINKIEETYQALLENN